jgi:hypothetical protein
MMILNGSPSLKDSGQHNDNGGDEQHGNQTVYRIAAEQTSRPKKHQYDSHCPRHPAHLFLPCALSVHVIAVP